MNATISDLKDAVCRAAHISADELLSKHRSRELSQARTVFCYFAVRKMEQTTVRTGKEIRRNHATVLYHCGRYPAEMRYPDFAVLSCKVSDILARQSVNSTTF